MKTGKQKCLRERELFPPRSRVAHFIQNRRAWGVSSVYKILPCIRDFSYRLQAHLLRFLLALQGRAYCMSP